MLWASQFLRKKCTSVGTQRADGFGVTRAARLSDSAAGRGRTGRGGGCRRGPRRGADVCAGTDGERPARQGVSTCRGQQQAWLSKAQKAAGDVSHAGRGAERGACGSPSSWSSASPPRPARSPVSHPRVQPRLWTHPGPRSRAQTEPAAGGIAKPATSKPPLGGTAAPHPPQRRVAGPMFNSEPRIRSKPRQGAERETPR